MGTKVQIENYLPVHSSMKDLSRESNAACSPSCYTDGSLPNGQYYNGFLPKTIGDSYPGYNKDVLKQTMLEQEAIFKDQVYELHRLYKVQRDLTDEVRRKEPFKHRIPCEKSSSSSPLPSQMQSEDAQRWNGSSVPLASPFSGRPLISGPDKGKSILAGPSSFHNCYSRKNSEVSESKPTKFRKGLDQQLPADEYDDTNEVEQFGWTISKPKGLADLNEPLRVKETTTFSSVRFLRHSASHSDVSYRDLPARLMSSSKDTPQNSKKGSLNGSLNNLNDIRANGQDWYCYALESEQYKANVRSINQGIHLGKAPMSFLGSHASSQPGLFRPSDLGKSWGQSAPSWGNPDFLSQKPVSIQPSPFLSGVNLSKSPQSLVQSYDFLGKWKPNSSPGINASLGSEPPVRNGLYCEKTGPYKGNNSLKATSRNDVNPVKDLNFNEALPNGVYDDYSNPRRLKIVDKDCKPEDPLAVLPWLKGKGGCSNGSGSSRNRPKDPPDIHGLSGYEEIESSKRKGFFDMNIPCDASGSDQNNMSADQVVVTEKKETKSPSFRNQFDLNSCTTEVENPCGIDLEALINLEKEDEILSVVDSLIEKSEKHPPEIQPDKSTDDRDAELVNSAASAIVAISMEEKTFLPPEPQGDDPLHWFVSIACASGNDADIQMVKNDGLEEELDDFEYMIVRLKECTLEEYFPKPSILDFTSVENSTTCTLTRGTTRKRLGRRGRLKQDFQRDILPGLTTLSRHEVTEDLQTFGAVMRATGYSWHPGPTRNGRGRGRRQTVMADAVCDLPFKQQQQVDSNNVKVGSVDRSLTGIGWGKTTRRPRRQRVPAGNPVLSVCP